MGPGGHLDLVGDLTVPRDRVVMGPIDSDDLGQQMGIRRVGLRRRGRMPLPVPGHLHWVDREHDMAGRQQRLHSRTPFGLNPNQHLIRLQHRIQMLRHQLVQRGDPGQTLRQPSPGQQTAGVIPISMW